jgi:hypothetical protein
VHPKEEIAESIREKPKHIQATAKKLDLIVAAKLSDKFTILREKFKTILYFHIKNPL